MSGSRFKKGIVGDEEVNFHPFQYGIIYHIDKNYTWVAAKNGSLKIKQLIYHKSLKIRKGKRFLKDNKL
ncbi:hypothetical protein IDH28_01960 [Pelagibacterales bacterium SAG-MED31]|nr:hypothetical protein [Pelagibacterales bacterium SAG-MED31]